jgi:hypothetical protein
MAHVVFFLEKHLAGVGKPLRILIVEVAEILVEVRVYFLATYLSSAPQKRI